ncbi:MAG TPA: CHAT domain-containing tetratricopeptide repeat protein [Symbiobacteriaceae bacterium]|nr:CHAT domain-containing tetratricopeptide repeat protein [Symbiobacteriaceae bacterium]
MTDQLEQRLRDLAAEWSRVSMKNVAQAHRLAEESMELAAGAGPVVRALALRTLGNSLRALGRLPEALAAVTEAESLFRKAGDEIEWARTINSALPILVQLDRNQVAIKAARTALNLLLKNGERGSAARLLNNMGAMYGNLGRPLDALKCFTQGEELAKETGQPDYEARLQANRTLILQQLGRYRESLTSCAKALRYWLRRGMTVAAARALQSGGIALLNLGHFGKALRRFSRARSLFESQSSARDVAVCDLYIAACYLELNRYDQMLARTRRVAEVLDAVQHGFQHAWVHLYEGVAFARTGRTDEARRSLAYAYKWFEERGHAAWAGKARLEEAEMLLAGNEPAAASKAAAKAARFFAAASMSTEEARAKLLMAESNLAAGKVKAADLAAFEAFAQFDRAHMPVPAFRCLHLQARVAMRRQDWATAHRYLTRAIATAERVRSTVHVSFRRSFLDDKSSVYADLVWVQLLQGRIRQAHRLVDLAKSRALVDELTIMPQRRRHQVAPADQELLAEIEQIRRQYQELTAPVQLGPEQAITLRGGVMSIPAQRAQLEARLAALWDEWELRQVGSPGSTSARLLPGARAAARKLAPGSAMVEYFVAGARLIAFVSDRSGLKGWVDLGSPEPVRRHLELLQLNFDTAVLSAQDGSKASPGLARNARSLLEALYRHLWEPLLPKLGAYRAVVIIPHGILHLVPFESLHSGSRYLVQDVEISLAPSRAAWLKCLERADRVDHAPGDSGDLVLGYNVAGLLPFIDVEARTVAAALQSEPLLRDQATVGALAGAGARRVVHIAAHGEFRLDNPYFSTLLLADGPLTAADAASLRLDSSLVALSGCETGLSRVTRGEELMGMVSAFLQAGSASVLASRWRVDDRTTADLMERFYQGLLVGEGKAEALRHAQILLAEQGLHPLYWAAFCLIGHSGPL